MAIQFFDYQIGSINFFHNLSIKFLGNFIHKYDRSIQYHPNGILLNYICLFFVCVGGYGCEYRNTLPITHV